MTITSKMLEDKTWTCQCEGCGNIRDILRLHPEPWHRRDDGAVLDANDALVMQGGPVATYFYRKFNEMLEGAE